MKSETIFVICHHCFFFGYCIFSHNEFIEVSYSQAVSEWRFYNPDKLMMAGEWPIFYSEDMFRYMCPNHTKESYIKEKDLLLIWLSVLRQIKLIGKSKEYNCDILDFDL
jgi:hypothetical protein